MSRQSRVDQLSGAKLIFDERARRLKASLDEPLNYLKYYGKKRKFAISLVNLNELLSVKAEKAILKILKSND